MAIKDRPAHIEDTWWSGVFAQRGVPDPGRIPATITLDFVMSVFARSTPGAGEALAALAVAQVAIRDRVPYDEIRPFDADIWRRWAESYGAEWPAAAVPAPWETDSAPEVEKAPWE